MRVRLADHSDIPAILAIYNDAILHTTATADIDPWTLEQRVEWFDGRVENDYPIFVAESDSGVVVGWSSYGQYSPKPGYRFTAEVSVYIDMGHRGQGFGSALLAPLVAAADERGIHTLVARIDGSNEISVRLHERFGFVRTGFMNEMYRKFDRWLDVVYMQRTHSDS